MKLLMSNHSSYKWRVFTTISSTAMQFIVSGAIVLADPLADKYPQPELLLLSDRGTYG